MENNLIELSQSEEFLIPPKQLEAYRAYAIELIGTRTADPNYPAKTNSA